MSRAVLILGVVVGSWLGMQAVHELGHVAAAWATGGRVERVVLHPLTISRTDLGHNPQPLIVAWSGPVVGAVLPLFAWVVATWCRLRAAFVWRFFAGFCLVANGLYVGLGSFSQVGDCGDILKNGSEPWHLWVFGLVTVPAGIWLWHAQGRHFGLGKDAARVEWPVSLPILAVSAALLTLGLVLGRG